MEMILDGKKESLEQSIQILQQYDPIWFGLKAGVTFTISCILIRYVVICLDTKEKRQEKLQKISHLQKELILQMRGGFLGFETFAMKVAEKGWGMLKDRLGGKVEEKVGDKLGEIVDRGKKEKDSNGKGKKTNLLQRLTVPLPIAPWSILVLIVSLLFLQNQLPEHPIEEFTTSLPNLPALPWAKKPTLWQKMKKFGGKLINFSTPYPYIIFIVGGTTVYFFTTTSSQRQIHSDAIVEISRQYAGALKHQFDSNMEYFKVLVGSVLDQSKENTKNVKDYLKTETARGIELQKKLDVADEIQKTILLHESQLNVTASLNTEKLKACKNEIVEVYTNLDDILAKSQIREQIIHDTIHSGTQNTPALITTEIQEKLNTLDFPKKTTYEDRKAEIEKRYPIEPQPKPLEAMLQENPVLGKKEKGKN